MPIICDDCGTVGVKIYYLCKSHDKPFHICNDCRPENRTCLEPPHQLREPYEDRYLEVKPPPEVIAEYIRRRIKSSKRDESNTMNFSEEEFELYRSHMAEKTVARILKKAPDLEKEIPDKIAKRSGGLFMLARLHWNQIEAAPSEGGVRDALKSLPKEYTKSYRKTIKRIEGKAQSDSKLAKRALRWVYYAKRPMSLQELRHALTVEILREQKRDADDSESDDDSDSDSTSSERHDSLDQKYLVEPGKLIDVTAGLLTFPRNGSVVELVHFTAREFFDTCHSQLFEYAEQEMSVSMMRYLMYSEFSEPSGGNEQDDEKTEVENRLQHLPFAAYASQFWGFHARNVQEVPMVSGLVGNLLRSPGHLASAVQTSCYAEIKNPTIWNWDIRKGVNALHMAAWFGLHVIIPDLVEEGLDVNVIDTTRFQATPLSYACKSGSVGAIKTLVNLKASVNWENSRGRTPLMDAAIHNQVHAIDTLLDVAKESVDVNYSDSTSMTALLLAAHKGNFEAVKRLLKQDDIEVNQQDNHGYTALAAAVNEDSLRTVKAILKHESVDVNQTDNKLASPLVIAAEKAQPKILSLLLERGAAKDKADRRGDTALLHAVDEDRLEVVEKLFPTDGETNDDTERDFEGQSALHIAAKKGFTPMVAWFLDQGVGVDLIDNNFRTPLHLAARNGHEAAVKLLLDRGADRKSRDSNDSSPADMAADAGYEELARMIDPDISFDNTDGERRTPTWKLAMQGSFDLLQERSSNGDNGMSERDSEGNTALHLSVKESHIDCVKLLLECGADMDAENNMKRTTLHMAAGTANPELLKLLLEQEHPPKLNALDVLDYTPLGIAIMQDSRESAVALIEAGAAFDRDSGPLRPVYERAIEDGKTFVAKKLLQSGLVELNLYKDSEIAKRSGNPAVGNLIHSYKSWVKAPEKQAVNFTIDEPSSQYGEDLTAEPESTLAKEFPSPPETEPGQRHQPDFSKPAFRPRPMPAD